MSSDITPNRRTIVTIDTPDVYTRERSVFIEKAMEQIADPEQNNEHTQTSTGTSTQKAFNVRYASIQGWSLKSQMEAGEVGYESDTFDDSALAMNTHPSVGSRILYRADTDLPGVLLGTNQRAFGYPMFQREIGAGGTFDGEFSGDRAAYPPAGMDEIQPLRRVAVSHDNIEPTDRISYRFWLNRSENIFGSFGAITRVYFTSLAGTKPSDGNAVGLGQYHLTLYGTGRAILHERLRNRETGAYSWVQRQQLFFDRIQTGLYNLTIESDAVKLPNGVYQGTSIGIGLWGTASTGHLESFAIELLVSTGIQAVSGGRDSMKRYRVPNPNRNQPELEKLRIDERRDMRSMWRVDHSRYFREGHIVTYPIELAFPTSNLEPLYVQWFGDMPTGTSIDIQCYDAETNRALTPLAPATNWQSYGYRGFDPTSGRLDDTETTKYARNKYYAVIILRSTDGKRTPVLRCLRYTRDRVLEDHLPTPIVLEMVESVSITGQDADPTHESATIRCVDLKGQLATLQNRSGMPIRVDVQYDPAHPEKVSTIFNGYVIEAKRRMRGGKAGNPWPVDNWAEYDIACTGEWHRLMETKTMQSICPLRDATTQNSTNLTWKITDLVRYLIEEAGYKDENILIEDLELRFFSSGNKDEMQVIEMFTEIYPTAARFVLHYLGGWIAWDANASNASPGDIPDKMGAWRLYFPPKPNAEGKFRNLAHFKHSPFLNTGLRLRYSENYQKTEAGIDGQTIKTIWVKKDSVTSVLVPPEANAVYVTGVGVVGSAKSSDLLAKDSGGNSTQPLTATAINYKAAFFSHDQPIPPDPTSPDYTNGRPVWIYVGDNALSSQAAVDFYCRRIYDLACHAQKRVSFEAPLILVTDVNDPHQRQPRKLQYGDPVLYQGEQYIVANCNPDYSAQSGGSRKMMASYEIFQPAEIDTWKTAGHLI